MTISRFKLRLTILSFIILLTANIASAQVQALPVVYVSANGGSDANQCTQTAPCREISRGLDLVMSGGTVIINGSGEYSAFTITKSVSIVAESGVTAIVNGTSTAINIATTSSSARVNIRGLTVNAASPNATGIRVTNPLGSLQINDCIIKGGETGLSISSAGSYLIKNTGFTGAVTNLFTQVSSGVINASVENCNFEKGGIGVFVGTNSKINITDSSAFGTSTGFYAMGSGARMFIENCRAVSNEQDGIYVGSSAWARVSNSTISLNEGYGMRNDGGSIKSFGNNRLSFNTSGDTSGTINSIRQL